MTAVLQYFFPCAPLEEQLAYLSYISFIAYIAQFKVIIPCPIYYDHGKGKTHKTYFFQCAGPFHI